MRASAILRLFPIVLPICVIGAGCGSGDRMAGGIVVRDSADLRIVESAAPVWPDGGGWHISADPTLDIGVIDGPREYQFHRILDVLRLRDGRILVANGGDRELRFYTRDGAHLQSVGGDGEGPGEFRDISGVILIGDSLLVYDRRLGRISVFRTNGAYRSTTQLGPTDDPIYSFHHYGLAGSLAARGLLMLPYAFDATPKPTPTIYWDSAANLVYDLTGALIDTLGSFSGMDMYGDPELGTQLIFGANSSAALHAGRLYIGHAHEYEIEVYARDGTLERLIRKQQEPTPVTDDLLDETVKRVLARVGDANARAALRRHYQKVPHAEYLPAYSGIVIDALGHPWVEQYRVRWRQGPRDWDIFDPDGRWLGTLALPDGFAVHEIGHDYVLGVWHSELGIEHVRMYRILKHPT